MPRNKRLGNVETLCRAYTVEATMALAAIMRDEGNPPAARVAAIAIILERGWGRPRIPKEDTDAKTDPIIVEIIQHVRQMKKVESLSPVNGNGHLIEREDSDG